MVSRTKQFRGRNRTHGRGKKAGRGAGKRGGRGLAGMNKHRVMTRLIHYPDRWGRHGFNRMPGLRTVHEVINICDLEELADGSNEVDLGALGYTRLLGRGRISVALKVRVDSASPVAIAKIEGAGGSVSGMSDFEEE